MGAEDESDSRTVASGSLFAPSYGAPGEAIGRYKLIEKIGEGGFGEVWLAEQKEPVKRRVALKIIKLGMDTKQVVARFEAERQALALMDHPNIAKVLDGGSTGLGRPYFVMELVKGIGLTDYCQRHAVPLNGRLALFMQACRAIQHAHQKGVIHRDIKPSNILVTIQDGAAVPKVIDFGIAKAMQMELTERTIHTQLNQIIGTPAYMSPEQAELTGIDIDTRSDIYSLGVLLYELLTGSTPFDTKELLSAGFEEMRRIIREREPARPSTRFREDSGGKAGLGNGSRKDLILSLRGDLDWIVLKCLEKDRTRRYETANGLALDIQRHLANEPVSARPQSAGYRLRKIAARNKPAVVAGAAVLAALCFGILTAGYAAFQARAAQREEMKLRRQAEDASSRAERNLYAADMLLAYGAAQNGNSGRARELLRKYQGSGGEPFRGWEWRHLADRLRGEETRVFRGHSDEVPVVLFLPDGKTIFTGGADRTFRFWDLASGRELRAWPHTGFARSAAVSPDGVLIAVADTRGQGLAVYESGAGRKVFAAANEGSLTGATFSRDGAFFAVTDDTTVHIYRAPEFQIYRTIERAREPGTYSFLKGLAFSPDSRFLAYGPLDGRIVVHCLADGSERTVGRTLKAEALTLAFSPDGKWLAAGDGAGIAICGVEQAKVIRELREHREQVLAVAFSPDGSRLASASGDQTIRLWNTSTWTATRELLGHEHEVQALAFSADGRWLLSGSKDETVRLWDLEQSPRLPESQTVVVARHRGGATRLLLAHTNRQVSVFDLARFRDGERQMLAPTNAMIADVSRDASRMAVALDDGSIELWGTEPFRRGISFTPASKPESVALSDDGRMVATLGVSEVLELWDADGVRRREFPARRTYWTSWVPPVRFVCNDTVIALVHWSEAPRVQQNLIEFHELASEKAWSVKLSHKGELTAYAISPDGKTLATAAWDGKIKLWTLPGGRESRALTGQLIAFTSLAFTSDGSRLAAGGWDGTITIWDLRNFQQVANWKAHSKTRDLGFLANDEILATYGGHSQNPAEEVALWRAPKLDPHL